MIIRQLATWKEIQMLLKMIPLQSQQFSISKVLATPETKQTKIKRDKIVITIIKHKWNNILTAVQNIDQLKLNGSLNLIQIVMTH